ncbi:hypothetical protein [Candidatus Raskinella chloraquaticus]|uniref:Uncharacterized protein n=1 Tax=Candidatus Raskinella chloraquaticus TaxID=1951219 RepID=A0A1W9I3X4_9HYPH|nr:MAG: hypothetical protein A4S15_04285 [Proteobacteria bacterium SG_bin8]
MVDFTDVLSRAVAGKKTYDERRAVYERARQALLNQLRALDPPLSESDVTRQRLALEESIRKIESEASTLAAASRAAALRRPSQGVGGAAAPSSVPRPSAAVADNAMAPPEMAPPTPMPEPIAPARAPVPPFSPELRASPMPPKAGEPAMEKSATDEFVAASRALPADITTAPRRPAPLPGASDKPPADRDQPGGRTAPVFDSRMEADDEGDPLIPRRPPHLRGVSSGTPLWRRLMMLGLIVLALAVAGAGGVILALRTQGSGAGKVDVPQPAPNVPAKSNDRIGQPNGSSTPATPDAAPSGQISIQTAVLYDENSQSTGGVDTFKGSVTWRVDSDNGAQGPERVIRGLAEIPERGLKLLLTIRRNLDQALPASHTVELLFDVPPNFAYGGVESLEQVFMKAAEQSNGLPLRGALARITSGYFLIGLSALGPNRENNIALLRDRPWIDVTFLYRNGRRAVLAVSKGEQGDKIFQEIFTQWGG